MNIFGDMYLDLDLLRKQTGVESSHKWIKKYLSNKNILDKVKVMENYHYIYDLPLYRRKYDLNWYGK